MFRDKKILIITAIMIVAGVLIYFLWSKNTKELDKNTNIATTIPVTSRLGRVFIQDLHQVVNEETRLSIEKTLYIHIEKTKPDLFTGTIRDGSYTKKLLTNNQTSMEFLVDIEPARLTYSVALTGRDNTYSITVRCAPKEQQVSTANTCKDILIL